MANLIGTNIAAPIVPHTTNDTYPTHDSIYGKGGYREVATIQELYNIPPARRSDGMLVYVQENKTIYKLNGALTNDYEELISSFSFIVRVPCLAALPSAGNSNYLYLVLDTMDMFLWDSDKIQFIKITPTYDFIICGDSTDS